MSISTPVDFDSLVFRKKDVLGEGFFGKVYRVTDGKKYVDGFVAKLFHTPKALALLNKVGYGVSYEKETTALKVLGPKDISPKVYFEKNTYSSRFYVMEAMNETLSDILIHDYFTREHLNKLTRLLQRLFETNYRHNDLHVNNVMWSDRLNDFRIVDWGMYDIDTKTNRSSGIKRMIRSGDMFNLVQLYVTYRIDIDGEEYWEKAFKEFLTLVPNSETLSKQLTKTEMTRLIKNGIINYLETNTTNTPTRSKFKSKKKSKSNKLIYREAKTLLGKPTNTAFVEMKNLTTRRKSSKRSSSSSRDVYRSSSSSRKSRSSHPTLSN